MQPIFVEYQNDPILACNSKLYTVNPTSQPIDQSVNIIWVVLQIEHAQIHKSAICNPYPNPNPNPGPRTKPHPDPHPKP